MDIQKLLQEAKATPLKPTATVVRGRNGKIRVEREELLSKSKKTELVEASKRAGKLRNTFLSTEQTPTRRALTKVRPRRFDLNSETDAFLEYLDVHGYAVVASVADPTEVEHAKDLFWNFLEGKDRAKANPYHARRDDPRTWDSDKGWLGDRATGIISISGVGQSSFMWFLRLLPKVRQAFGAIWGVEDDELLCSFDGANVFRPWQYKPEWRTNGGWYHVDQNAYNPGKAGRCSVQGLVTLTEADEYSGGLVVIPGSHKDFLDVCERNAKKPWNSKNKSIREFIKEEGKSGFDTRSVPQVMDYVPVPETDEVLSKAGCLVCAKPGDLIVWDSRTVHCNSPALETETSRDGENKVNDRLQNRWDLIRMVGYVCMTPTSWASEDVLRKRWDAYVKNLSTSHWPHHFTSGTKGAHDMPNNNPNNTSQIQRNLIGGWIDSPESLKDEP